MKLTTLLLIYFLLFSETNAIDKDNQLYRIVTNKQYMSLCIQKYLKIRHGYIKQQSIIDINKHFFVEYEIQTRSGLSLVVCDLNTGEIINEKK
jgi:hypothetical protein